MAHLLLQILVLAIGFVLLIKGADLFVDGAAKIAERFGIPQLVIGLTIVAFGTSAPEAAVSITAALKGNADITIGNVVGSNILNVLIILGITALIVPLAVQKSTLRYEIPFTILVSAVFAWLGMKDGYIGRADGLILWAGMILFLVYLFRMAKKGENVVGEIPEDTGQKESVWRMLLSIGAGLILIIWGADLSVGAASELARAFGVSERLIALTVVALGTSLPELFTSVTAGIKGNADIAVGNIVGSNIFNILFVVGTSALVTPVRYGTNFMADSIVMVGAAALLLICVLRTGKLRRAGGIVMLLSYAGYFAYLISR